jgi:hypothetical protein
MAASKLNTGTFGEWVAAPKVFEQMGDLGSRFSGVNALADRLRTGLARAGAEHRTLQLRNPETGPLEIPQYHWPTDGLFQNDLWQTGQLTVFARQRSAPYEQERYDYYGVRFDPIGIDALWAAAGKVRQGRAFEVTAADDSRPRIQDAWLEAWADLFNKLYPDKDADFALKSAQGMFHDKSVSRDRVRPLVRRGRGRPKTAN